MSNPEFVHLHNHSYYSLLDGLTSVEDLVNCAIDLGYKSLALTDHGSCSGLFSFQKICNEKNIKPILGMEAYTTENIKNKEKDSDTNHLIILAKNKIGYNNLIYLSSMGYLEGFYYKPRIDFNLLQEHKDGLIISSACIAGEIPDLLLRGEENKACNIASKYKDVFGDDFYIEIMAHTYEFNKKREEEERNIAGQLYKLSKKVGIKAICTQDTHYAHAGDWEAHDILLSIQTLKHIKNPNRLTFASKDFYLKHPTEMASLYKSTPSLLTNTIEICEKIEDDKLIPTSQDLLPSFQVPEGYKNEEQYLKALIIDGMKAKGFINNSIYRDRIKYEMKVIINCKFTKYFLILWDIINFAKKNNIRTGIGRGSAVSSLCLYVLDITKLDPIKYDLIFERFLNPDRVSPPDVDIDFDYNRREEVYNYVVRKYGSDHCSQISTYNSLKARAAIRGTAKALDIGNDWEETQKLIDKNPGIKVEPTKNTLNIADIISKGIPFNSPNIEAALKPSNKKSEEFRMYMEKYPKLLQCARQVEGTLSSAGVHPAGMVVCKNKVIDKVPLRVSNGVICTQYDKDEVEEIGLLKYDLLAIKTLTMIENTLKLIKERHPSVGYIDIDRIEPNDKKVFELYNGIDNKNTMGLFQFESWGMVKLLKDLRVDTFDDLIVAVALYRPGPLGSGIPETYCHYKHGYKKIKHLHPKMGEVLKKTYGMMCFQEDIMKVAKHLAGFTGGQSDTLRKAVGKKKPELLKKQKELFVNGCLKNGISKEIAEEIFRQIDYFSGYGFNLSHAAAYAYISYQTAYLKTYYPIEFMCNLLTSEIDNNDKNDKLDKYINSAERMGIVTKDIDINKSGLGFKIEKGISQKSTSKKGQEIEFLRSPMTIVKGVGSKAVQNIVDNQPYENLESFIKRTDARIVNIRVFTTLVDNGAFSELCGNDNKLITNKYEFLKKNIDKEKKEKKRQEEITAKRKSGGTLFDEDINEATENKSNKDNDFDHSGKDLKF